MKKSAFILSLIFAMSLLVSCGSDTNDGSGEMFDASLYKNPQSLDPQIADDVSSRTVISNMFSGLLSLDSDGNVVNDNAESYEISADGLSYKFKLRKDNYWFRDTDGDEDYSEGEYFPVTAHDYVFAFQRLFNPETRSNLAGNFICIKNSEKIMQGKLSPEETGVYAEDDYTLVFQLEHSSADFLKLLTTSPALPCNEEFFYSTKGRYGLDEDSVISNGAFFMRQWFYDPYGNHNILYMKRNSVNSQYDKVYPSYLSFSIEDSQEDINSEFISSDLDCISTLEFDSRFSKKKYSYDDYRSITLGLIFNPKDPIYSNENLRKALAYGINRESAKKKIDSDVEMAGGLIAPAVTLLGRSYRELSADDTLSVYDEKKALEYLEKAKSELNRETFDTVKILVCNESVNPDELHVLSQQWSDLLGIYIGIEEVTESDFYSRLDNGDYSIALYPVTADYNSGISFLYQFAKNPYFDIKDDTKQSITDLSYIADAQDYVSAFSDIERDILNQYCYIPVFYKNTYLVMKSENTDILYEPFSQAVNFQYAKNFD
ncbi:MAG: peptide ABC transporter substrate-binding protein [Ruminococcus sp.]|nr:peptide ABC transporter substrate-binding protein [Oscillospiraceae bacterium]MDY4413971.1 peptide ABC transporter substrate-binding protein [Ruminococcus sp.]